MLDLHALRENHLLAALPAAELEHLSSHLELIKLPLNAVLHESGDKLRYIYFPTTAIVSLLYTLENGASTEVAMVGNEGIVGVALFMGDAIMPNQAVVQNAGYAYRLGVHKLIQEFDRSRGRRNGTLHRLLLSYTQMLITQMGQTAVCNQHHSVEQQLCRWLLLSLDRLHSSELVITQELIASMLGVRRESVTEAVGRLQQAGLLKCSRGHIMVLNRPGLERRSCECYQIVKVESDRLSSPFFLSFESPIVDPNFRTVN